jgi:hypothetical protein
MVDYCDSNGDGIIDDCEVHACIVMTENTWRNEDCPGYPHIQCDCDLDFSGISGVVDTCEGAWYCEDIEMIAASDMEYYDSNGNGAIDYSDNMDPAHMDLLNETCDTNGDG